LLDSCEKILDYTKNTNYVDDFAGNAVVFDAVMMNFIVIGETVSKLSINLKEQYDYVEWIKITNFRNIVAHDYSGIDIKYKSNIERSIDFLTSANVDVITVWFTSKLSFSLYQYNPYQIIYKNIHRLKNCFRQNQFHKFRVIILH